jgi:hypothetical protein
MTEDLEQRRRLLRLLFAAAVVAIAVVRLRHCSELTVNTADLVRHLLYGLLVEFWYVLVFPTMVLPIAEARARRTLLLLWPLLDVRSLIQLVVGPFGYVSPDLAMPNALAPYVLPPGL